MHHEHDECCQGPPSERVGSNIILMCRWPFIMFISLIGLHCIMHMMQRLEEHGTMWNHRGCHGRYRTYMYVVHVLVYMV